MIANPFITNPSTLTTQTVKNRMNNRENNAMVFAMAAIAATVIFAGIRVINGALEFLALPLVPFVLFGLFSLVSQRKANREIKRIEDEKVTVDYLFVEDVQRLSHAIASLPENQRETVRPLWNAAINEVKNASSKSLQEREHALIYVKEAAETVVALQRESKELDDTLGENHMFSPVALTVLNDVKNNLEAVRATREEFQSRFNHE